MLKILITGASGLLGSNLAYAYRKKYEILGTYNTHKVGIADTNTTQLDLLELNKVKALVNGFKPDVVIHCAALSDVDKCEEDKELAYRLNVGATENIVAACEKIKPELVYISTDSVYDGIKGNFKEDQAHPINYYGKTKLLGEEIASGYENNLILRVNFFGWNIREKYSLAEWMISTFEHGKPLNAFHDAIFSPLYIKSIAGILELAIEENLAGVYNLGSVNSLSKYDFAVCVSEAFQLDRSKINRISIDAFPFKAPRGKILSLDVSKIQKALKVKSQTVKESITDFHEDYVSGLQKNMRGSSYGL